MIRSGVFVACIGLYFTLYIIGQKMHSMSKIIAKI